MKFSRSAARRKRHARVRRKIIGSAQRPRLMFFRSLHHIYACIINDAVGHTLVSVSTRESKVADGLKSKTNLEAAARVGSIIAERAVALGITSVVFDTGGVQYHGRAAALADAAREAKLEF
jgi:large subunit ribosomal protein L18